MKKLSIALLSTFTASIPSYAQSGVIDAIIETETVQVTQNVNDMLGDDGGDYGYYDSYDYGHGDGSASPVLTTDTPKRTKRRSWWKTLIDTLHCQPLWPAY